MGWGWACVGFNSKRPQSRTNATDAVSRSHRQRSPPAACRPAVPAHLQRAAPPHRPPAGAFPRHGGGLSFPPGSAGQPAGRPALREPRQPRQPRPRRRPARRGAARRLATPPRRRARIKGGRRRQVRGALTSSSAARWAPASRLSPRTGRLSARARVQRRTGGAVPQNRGRLSPLGDCLTWAKVRLRPCFSRSRLKSAGFIIYARVLHIAHVPVPTRCKYTRMPLGA